MVRLSVANERVKSSRCQRYARGDSTHPVRATLRAVLGRAGGPTVRDTCVHVQYGGCPDLDSGCVWWSTKPGNCRSVFNHPTVASPLTLAYKHPRYEAELSTTAAISTKLIAGATPYRLVTCSRNSSEKNPSAASSESQT